MSAPAPLLGDGMTAEEWALHCQNLKQVFLARNAMTPGAPFPNLPELRLPKSNVRELSFAGGETEGLVI